MSTEDPGNTPEPTEEPTLTQSDFNKALKGRLGEQSKKHSAEIEALKSQLANVEELQSKLAALEEEREMAGKTAAEQAEAKAAKERARMERQREELAAQIKERDAQIEAVNATLRAERLNVQLTAALGKHKVMQDYMGQAVALASMNLTDVTHGENGAITASFGDVEDAPLSEVVAEWVKANPLFLPAPSGGGTRNNRAGGGGRNLQDMSTDELLAADAARRRAR